MLIFGYELDNTIIGSIIGSSSAILSLIITENKKHKRQENEYVLKAKTNIFSNMILQIKTIEKLTHLNAVIQVKRKELKESRDKDNYIIKHEQIFEQLERLNRTFNEYDIKLQQLDEKLLSEFTILNTFNSELSEKIKEKVIEFVDTNSNDIIYDDEKISIIAGERGYELQKNMIDEISFKSTENLRSLQNEINILLDISDKNSDKNSNKWYNFLNRIKI